jgi:hypothetical protein
MPESPRAIAWLLCVWMACAVYVAPFVNRGWVPHDEGLLAQSAERVLAGELPHRDFDEVYTGGLSYLHALAFEVAGPSLLSLRWMLFFFFLCWTPIVFWIASRVTPPPLAALVTFIAVVWSVPNYFASLPSWYNLFFATLGVAALMRHVETDRVRWLYVAGLAGGLSFLVKSAALYYIAGAGLFLISREALAGRSIDSAPKLTAALAAKVTLAVVLTGAVVWLVRSHPGWMAVVHFVVPVLCVGLLFVWIETERSASAAPARAYRLARLLTPFALGVVVPVAAFLVPYALSGALGDFYRGVFVTPQLRLAAARFDLPPWFMLVPVIPYAVVMVLASVRGTRFRVSVSTAVAFAAWLVSMLAISAALPGYQMLWSLARQLNVVVALAGSAMLYRVLRAGSPPEQSTQFLLLLVSVTAFSSLIEFPFAAPIYFCYTAPLIALTLAAIAQLQPPSLKPIHLAVALSLLLFGIVRLNAGYVYMLGFQADTYVVAPSGIARAGLRLPDADREDYRVLLDLIGAHARGRYLYAAPDCPEVYFLSGLANPTRTFYEVFDRRPMTPGALGDLLDDHGITVAVVNTTPAFSSALDPRVEAAITARFPYAARAGRFLVRWRT